MPAHSKPKSFRRRRPAIRQGSLHRRAPVAPVANLNESRPNRRNSEDSLRRFADSAMRCRGLREDETKWRTGLPGSRGRGWESAHRANMKERSRPPRLILTRSWRSSRYIVIRRGHLHPGADHEHVSRKLTDVSQKPDK